MIDEVVLGYPDHIISLFQSNVFKDQSQMDVDGLVLHIRSQRTIQQIPFQQFFLSELTLNKSPPDFGRMNMHRIDGGRCVDALDVHVMPRSLAATVHAELIGNGIQTKCDAFLLFVGCNRHGCICVLVVFCTHRSVCACRHQHRDRDKHCKQSSCCVFEE